MWLRQYRAIVRNSFIVTLGDPFYLILHLTALFLIALLGCVPGFTYGEHMQLYRDQCQALIFIIGCLGITFGIIRAVTDDLRRGAGSILLSRPIGPTCLIFGKWSGVFISIVLLHISELSGYLWISEVTSNSDFLNLPSLILYLSIIIAALLVSAGRHFLFNGSYVFYANIILSCLLVLGIIIKVVIQGNNHFDWLGLQSGAVLLFGIIVFSSLILPVAVAADSVMVLGIGIIVFFFGLISEYLINIILLNKSLSLLGKAIVPNWQIFWVSDRLGEGLSIPIDFYGTCAIQAFAFLCIYVIIATILYERMEIQGE